LREPRRVAAGPAPSSASATGAPAGAADPPLTGG
jgi:hypothetical protein